MLQGLNSALQDVELLAAELQAAAPLVGSVYGACALESGFHAAVDMHTVFSLPTRACPRHLRHNVTGTASQAWLCGRPSLSCLRFQQDGRAIDTALQRFSETRAPSIRALQELEMLQARDL